MMRPHWKYLLLTVFVTAALSYGVLWRGINIGPDGWAFWEGAVSMQQGYGYSYFHARLPVLSWPPLYPLYLMCWQIVAGISGATLIAANVALAALGAALWVLLFLRLAPEGLPERWRRWHAALLLLSLALFFAYHAKGVGTENLRYAILPVYLMLLLPRRDGQPRNTACHVAGLALAGTALMLTHHSMLAFLLAGTVWLTLRRNGRPSAQSLLPATAGLLLPVALWMGVRWMLGQLGSHPGYVEVDHSFLGDNLISSGDALAMLWFGPVPHAPTVLALYAGLLVAVVASFRMRPSGIPKGPASRFAPVIAVLSFLFLLLICQAARIPILTRFLWFLPLLLLPWLLGLAFTLRSAGRWLLLPVLLLPGIVKGVLLLHATFTDASGYISGKERERFVTPEMYIDARQPGVGPMRTERGLLVTPPVYEWLERRVESREEYPFDPE